MTQTTAAASPHNPDEQRLIDAATEPGPGTETLEQDPDEPDHEPPRAAATVETHTAPTTRDRILDVALDLFTTQGFDGTSLRQIAERLDITKAALYYHFESKDDILMALHMRLHAFGRTALIKMQQEPVSHWLYYITVDAIDAAQGRVKSAGGTVINGPMEVPGGSWIINGLDPQGAMFALVAPKR